MGGGGENTQRWGVMGTRSWYLMVVSKARKRVWFCSPPHFFFSYATHVLEREKEILGGSCVRACACVVRSWVRFGVLEKSSRVFLFLFLFFRERERKIKRIGV